MVLLRLRDLKGIVASAVPAAPKVRARVETFIRAGSGDEGRMMLLPWTAGVDGAALARAIDEGIGGTKGKAN
jgi:hypothetical protein